MHLLYNKIFKKNIILLVLLFGVIVRITLFLVSPPSNSFDDHMEVIKLYADTSERPMPFFCWECYQPPAYYVIAASIYNTANFASDNNYFAWKIVQLINPLLSILILLVFYKLLFLFKIPYIHKILYLSFISVLPIDVFTSSMIGNDYLLAFSTIACFYWYIKTIEYSNSHDSISIRFFILLSFFTILGGLTKQHGLLLVILPFSILFYFLIKKEKQAFTILLPIVSFIFLAFFMEEYWKYSHTGKFLASNQDFFDYAINQFPGSIDLVEFNTFRLISLFKSPFMTNETASSFFTELFARTFFDYEWRFSSPKIPINLFIGRFGYFLGIIWVLYFLTTTIIWIEKRNYKNMIHLIKNKFKYIPLFILGISFFVVPLLQTIRYPYFSSMKSTFMLPGIIIMVLIHSLAIRKITFPPILNIVFVLLNLFYGLILIVSISYYLPIVMNHLSGPLWRIPI